LGVRTLGRLAEAEKLGALVELLRDHRAADGVEEGDGGAPAVAGTCPGSRCRLADTLRDGESSLTGRDDSDGFFMIVLD
jgi:hypothetical protein